MSDAQPATSAAVVVAAEEEAEEKEEQATIRLNDGAVVRVSARLLLEKCPALHAASMIADDSRRRSDLSGVTGPALAVVVDWLRSGGSVVRADNGPALVQTIAAARKLGLSNLAGLCLAALAAAEDDAATEGEGAPLLHAGSAVAVFATARAFGVDAAAGVALGVFVRNTRAALAAASDETVAALPPAALRELLSLSWITASEDDLFAFVLRWAKGAAAAAAAAESAEDAGVVEAMLGLVDMHRLSGPALTSDAAKRWATAEPGRYRRMLEELLVRDTAPALPPPLRLHGVFALGPAHGPAPAGRRLLEAREFVALVPLLAEQYAAEGGCLPVLGGGGGSQLFEITDPTVRLGNGRVPVADGSHVRIRGVSFVDASKISAQEAEPVEDAEGTEQQQQQQQQQLGVTGWARLSLGGYDPSHWPTAPASWTFEAALPRPAGAKGDSPAIFVFEGTLPKPSGYAAAAAHAH